LAGGVPDVTPLVEMWARGSRFRRLVEPPVRAVKAGRSPPGGEALRARYVGDIIDLEGPPGPSYMRLCPSVLVLLRSRQFPLKAVGLAEPRGPVIPPSRWVT
jgi:hypothetical protein